MAKDVIHYDTQCMEALHAELGRIRKTLQSHATTLRMINLVRTGADIHTCRMPSISLKTTGTRVSSGLTPIVLHRSASAISDLAEYIEVLQKKLLRVAEMFEACERDLANTTMEDYPEPVPEINLNNTKEEDLAEILRMLHDVTPPDQLPSVQLAENELSSLSSILDREIYNFISGNYLDGMGLGTNFYHDLMYTYDSFFDAFVPDDFVLLSMDDIPFLIPGSDMYDLLVNFLKINGFDGKFTGALSLGSVMTDEMLTAFNQYRLLQSLDKEAVLERAAVYKQASDVAMNTVGYTMEILMNADPLTQLMMINGRYTAGIADDLANYLAGLGLDEALNLATGYAWEAVSNTFGRNSGVADAAINADNIAGLSTNVMISADNVRETYDIYKDAMAAYDANPNEENLKKAVDAYEAYEHASADSMNAMDALYDNTEDSAVGFIDGVADYFIEGESPNAASDWREAQRDHHRQQAENMSKLYDQYKSK